MKINNLEGITRMQCRHRRRLHRRQRIKKILYVTGILLLTILLCGLSDSTSNIENVNNCTSLNDVESSSLVVRYTSLNVPNINSAFKRWMDYRKTSCTTSPQFKFIRQYGWSDGEGFMRCNAERMLGINDDYYMIALGSYYGTTIGTKYRVTTDTGNVFYGVLAECKADIHTNSTHQYTNQKNPDIVEFLIDKKKLNKDVRRAGSANAYMPLNGNISKIERMEFVTEG